MTSNSDHTKKTHTIRFTVAQWAFLLSRKGGACAYLSAYVENDPEWKRWRLENGLEWPSGTEKRKETANDR